MPKNVTQYDLLVSCPGDVIDEIECIESVVNQFNLTFADSLGISIRVKHWSNSSYPQSGGKPQTLLNDQFVNDCDAAVAIMWTRFGTPTDKYGSGTEEEIELMLNNDKQVFMYFCDRPIPPSKMISDEYKRIVDFKNKYKDRGIYHTYNSVEDFKKKFFAHLSQHFLSLKKVESIKEEKHSELVLKGINLDNRITDCAVINQFGVINEYDKDGYLSKIKDDYYKIASIIIKKENVVESFKFRTPFPVTKINDDVKKNIQMFAKALEIGLPNDFFDVGRLTSIPQIMGNGAVSGTKEEENKYYLINELNDTINDFIHWASANKSLEELKFIRLVLANDGTNYDEDVEVTLSFPKSALVTIDSFPCLEKKDIDYLLYEKGLDTLVHIHSNVDYSDYSESVVRKNNKPVSVNYVPSIYQMSYSNSRGFYDCLFDELGLEIFDNGEYYIAKLKFDYIKHNTAVAFPSVILLHHELKEIPYVITSKHSAEKIVGTLLVMK